MGETRHVGRDPQRVITPAVFLDRDGVINAVLVRQGKPYAPATLEEFNLLPRVETALARLRAAGYRLIVVTNQPDVGAGRQRRDVVEAMHARLRDALPVDDIRVCYHQDMDGCECRKPKPGLLIGAALDWSIALDRSYMVGDRWRDVNAGRAAGCQTILVRSGHDEPVRTQPDAVVDSLFEASGLIVDGRL